MEAFSIFGIAPPQLSLNLAELEKKYHQLSFEYHPDRNPNVDEALAMSAKINKAYRILRDPWDRLRYLFSQMKGELSKTLPPALMELYFGMQEAQSADEMETTMRALQAKQLELEARREILFKEFDATTDHQGQIAKMAALILEKNYSESMLREMKSRS